MRILLVGLLFSCSFLAFTGCSKTEIAKPGPSMELKEFIPAGWSVEFDTVAPLLEGGRKAHLVVLTAYDSAQHFSSGRMVLIVGRDKNGKMQRYGANKSLLKGIDMASDDYVPAMSDMVRLTKDVITITTQASNGKTESIHRKEIYKLRYEAATKRLRLIGYDFVDNTDGIRTLDSRNYITKKRGIQMIRDKDTLFHRTLALRHSGTFLEDLQPWQLAVDPTSLHYAKGPLPETSDEVVNYYDTTPSEDSTETYDFDNVSS